MGACGRRRAAALARLWIPAYAGMTVMGACGRRRSLATRFVAADEEWRRRHLRASGFRPTREWRSWGACGRRGAAALARLWIPAYAGMTVMGALAALIRRPPLLFRLVAADEGGGEALPEAVGVREAGGFQPLYVAGERGVAVMVQGVVGALLR